MNKYKQRLFIFGFEGPAAAIEAWSDRLMISCGCSVCQDRSAIIGSFAAASSETARSRMAVAVDPVLLSRFIALAAASPILADVSFCDIDHNALMESLNTVEKTGIISPRFRAITHFSGNSLMYTFRLESSELTMTALLTATGDLIGRYLRNAIDRFGNPL